MICRYVCVCRYSALALQLPVFSIGFAKLHCSLSLISACRFMYVQLLRLRLRMAALISYCKKLSLPLIILTVLLPYAALYQASRMSGHDGSTHDTHAERRQAARHALSGAVRRVGSCRHRQLAVFALGDEFDWDIGNDHRQHLRSLYCSSALSTNLSTGDCGSMN